jgi:prevent-host-death family protein
MDIGGRMKRMASGTFKPRCLRVIEGVQATGEPIVITKRGKPVVQLAPVGSGNGDVFGFMVGKFKIVGDIESPVVGCSGTKTTNQTERPRGALALGRPMYKQKVVLQSVPEDPLYVTATVENGYYLERPCFGAINDQIGVDWEKLHVLFC